MSKSDKELLITGFEPFGGQLVNPSWEAAAALPEYVGEYHLTRMEIPVEFTRAASMVCDTAKELKPDVILCIGQAGGRRGITPEMVGINLRDASAPDNAGHCAADEPIVPGGPAAYFATVPVKHMVNAIRECDIPCFRSCSAGTYVCNDVLYSLLHHFDGTGTKVGFIHVPFLPEQTDDSVFSLPLDDIVTALIAAIKAL